jgi:drug/metabolite transporter (DMT)-like permease
LKGRGLNFKVPIAGFVFAILWASAATATKIGLEHAQPFVISVTRFFTAGFIMLFLAHILLKEKTPSGTDWRKLMVYGLLNISIYLGIYIVAMQHASAGIGSLFIATNPVFISLISGIYFKQPINKATVISLFICSAGIMVASYPLLHTSYVSPIGLVLLLAANFSYSVSALYYSRQSWNGMHILTINGWQTLFGGIFLLPVLAFTYKSEKNIYNHQMILSVLWLALPVSIAAVQLWLFLLKNNPVKASFWLFLCPIFGIITAAIIMKEPVTAYTFAGVMLVLAGLYIVQRFKSIQQ